MIENSWLKLWVVWQFLTNIWIFWLLWKAHRRIDRLEERRFRDLQRAAELRFPGREPARHK